MDIFCCLHPILPPPCSVPPSPRFEKPHLQPAVLFTAGSSSPASAWHRGPKLSGLAQHQFSLLPRCRKVLYGILATPRASSTHKLLMLEPIRLGTKTENKHNLIYIALEWVNQLFMKTRDGFAILKHKLSANCYQCARMRTFGSHLSAKLIFICHLCLFFKKDSVLLTHMTLSLGVLESSLI